MNPRGCRLVMCVAAFPKLSETFVVHKFLGLASRGWDVHVVCRQSDARERRGAKTLQRREFCGRIHVSWRHEPRWRAALLLPLQVLRCLTLNPRGTLRYLRAGWNKWRWGVLRHLYLDAEFVVLAPDIIHFEFGALASERMHLRHLLGAKCVVSFRGYDLSFVGLDDPEHYRDVWDDADAIHVLGRQLWERARQRGCPPDKAHYLIAPAVDTERCDGERPAHTDVVGTSERPLRVLSVGRLEWVKGYEYALQAISCLVKQGVCVEHRILGGGNYLESVAFCRRQLGLEECVHILGAGEHGGVIEQMRWADVLLHAAVSEGFCNAVLEAQAMRLPIVCSDAGGLPDNVVDGNTGFVVPRRNPVAMAQRLTQLAQDPELRQLMGDRGRARVRCGFELSQQIDALERMYRSVAAPNEEMNREYLALPSAGGR